MSSNILLKKNAQYEIKSQQEIRKTSWLKNFWAKSSHIIILENLFQQNQAKDFDYSSRRL